ncbi:bifunctional nicotinamide-nucleotide adenylyltransferase/Nudix hydroxylase [Muricoccus radiodurans]|uniref:bifunctional nicotinamide-nucleotide adenylyltransferase/Nudix hydroxylase n=1 Tax=Muricoccus radiodurans TaxID=2231721 RepID=UPI003CF5F950
MSSTLTLRRKPAARPRRADLAVFIGRFQPGPHLGHLSVIRAALQAADRLAVVIGSANGPRSHHNPFTYDERRHMLEACLTVEERERVTTIRVSDHLYNDDAWIEDVQRAVNTVGRATAGEHPRIALIGHSKDRSSFYLRKFPEWESIEVPNFGGFSSTPMRDLFFSRGGEWVDDGAAACLPEGVRGFLRHFSGTTAFRDLVTEYDFIRDYRRKWGEGPFVTTDAVVIQSAHVLLVRRAGRPGKGLWALPGGFLEIARRETLLEGMIRELREETAIRLGDGRPEVVERILRGSVVHTEAFDEPFRDPRARIITHAFLVALEPRRELPEVHADTDAEAVKWEALADLREEALFADHFHIIRRFKGLLPKPKSV